MVYVFIVRDLEILKYEGNIRDFWFLDFWWYLEIVLLNIKVIIVVLVIKNNRGKFF